MDAQRFTDPPLLDVTAGIQRVELGPDLLREIRGTSVSRVGVFSSETDVSVIAVIPHFVFTKNVRNKPWLWTWPPGGPYEHGPCPGGLVEERHVMTPGCGATGWGGASRLRGSLEGPFPW